MFAIENLNLSTRSILSKTFVGILITVSLWKVCVV